ncbi:glycosyltransferase family 4 protein [Humisphaera borealis]|uniref:Glycosyltransferase family 4 protein n=1 Tax=Humisphaera borealis TaxID=2807512 RepID=A0A7M2WYS4_9BACT|nr:glycosyltransferase family 4 protein [Humisphaera borealis]QOV90626.1 glycosyltransferase family 4 protein [Humisphaera borealis]
MLFFVEGFTDIRFVVGLSQLCHLTMVIPARTYEASCLKERVATSGARVTVVEIAGGRVEFQVRSFIQLLSRISAFDVVLAQEVTRGALNANLAGRLLGVPVVNYMGIAPVEYFACRRERRQISLAKHLLGNAVIRTLLHVNGRLTSMWLAMGPYLRDIGKHYCSNTIIGLYYGVDTNFFRPACASERRELRRKHDLPENAFLIFLSSRMSHEKDPETVLLATHAARQRGLPAVLLNLGGGYRDFLSLAEKMGLPDPKQWVLGRPAAHPMTEVADYFRTADVMALASLAEGAAYSTLEALSCATPVVATAVGGMAVQLNGHARLTPRQDPDAMAAEFLWIASHPEEARSQALRARETYIVPDWERSKAFRDLGEILVAAGGRR